MDIELIGVPYDIIINLHMLGLYYIFTYLNPKVVFIFSFIRVRIDVSNTSTENIQKIDRWNKIYTV